MPTLWFALIALTLTVYVVLDGFDLGTGIVHFLVTRKEGERRLVLHSIGPVWDGNEVWLLAAGGSLYFAFPALYAVSFSGFYLPLMMVLWLLILRGCSIEFRNHVANEVWRPFWDGIFCLSSLLLAIFFGAALGNVVRGVPLDGSGRFFEPLWVDFRPGPAAGILDWYTVLVGVGALAALTMHGARWVALKTPEPIAGRARGVARLASVASVAVVAGITWCTLKLQPQVLLNLKSHPWGYGFPLLALSGIAMSWFYGERKRDAAAFVGSSAFLAGMLASAAFGIYPYVLPSILSPRYGLTVANAAAPDYGLRIGLTWWLIGMALAAGYVIFAYRRFAGRVSAESTEDGYGGGHGS